MKQNGDKPRFYYLSRFTYSFTFQIAFYFFAGLLIAGAKFYLPMRLPALNHPTAQEKILIPAMLFGILILVISVVMFIKRWRESR